MALVTVGTVLLLGGMHTGWRRVSRYKLWDWFGICQSCGKYFSQVTALKWHKDDEFSSIQLSSGSYDTCSSALEKKEGRSKGKSKKNVIWTPMTCRQWWHAGKLNRVAHLHLLSAEMSKTNKWTYWGHSGAMLCLAILEHYQSCLYLTFWYLVHHEFLH